MTILWGKIEPFSHIWLWAQNSVVNLGNPCKLENFWRQSTSWNFSCLRKQLRLTDYKGLWKSRGGQPSKYLSLIKSDLLLQIRLYPRRWSLADPSRACLIVYFLRYEIENRLRAVYTWAYWLSSTILFYNYRERNKLWIFSTEVRLRLPIFG